MRLSLGLMARTMAIYQQEMLAGQRLQSGGTQRIIVQHVTVEDGGQAVVAGEVGSRKK
jgi:hypothetical protein